MKQDYLLVFTKNADHYNMEKQLSFYTESDIYKYNVDEDYDKIVECANEAAYKGYKSFHFITMSEDWQEYDYDMKREFTQFKEVGVIKANFKKRLYEADQNSQQQNKTQQTQQPKKLGVVFPYQLVPKEGGIPKVDYLDALNKKINGRQVSKTFYIKNKNASECSPLQYYKIFVRYFGKKGFYNNLTKNYPVENWFYEPSTSNAIIVSDLSQLINYAKEYEIISPLAVPGIEGQAEANCVVSEQNISNFYSVVNAEYNSVKEENLAGTVSKKFEEEVFAPLEKEHPLVINYINGSIYNTLTNFEHLEINDFTIINNNTIVGDTVSQAVGWEDQKKVNQDTPFFLAQDLIGHTAKMATNYGGVNDNKRQQAADATANIALNKVPGGEKAANYFNTKNDVMKRAQSVKKASIEAKLAWERDLRELQDKKSELTKKYKALSSEDNEEAVNEASAIESEIKNISDTIDFKVKNKDSLIKNYIDKVAYKDVNKEINGTQENSKDKIKNMQSYTRYANMIKKLKSRLDNDTDSFRSLLDSYLKAPVQQQI